MIETTKQLKCDSGSLFLRIFLPETKIKAIVQINHGLAEHSGRYLDFARYLCTMDYGVYIHDLPGHGETASEIRKLGVFPWKKGWDSMLNSIHAVNKSIRKKYPDTPVFIMGHSMGSLLTRHYNATYPMYFKGMILSGTSDPQITTLKISRLIIKTIKLFYRASHKSKWVNQYFYSHFNKTFDKQDTYMNWLSSDKEAVARYNDDPYCGFDLSLAFYKNLFEGSLQLLRVEQRLKFRKNFSTLIISGQQDAVGDFGQGPKTLHKKMKDQGFLNTTLMLVPGRHELLHETNSQDAYEAIAKWMNDRISANRSSV